MGEWWRHYGDQPGNQREPRREAQSDLDLSVGAQVRLAGKPEHTRKILRVDWHWQRHRPVYIVETTAPGLFEPYWFAEQLISA